MPRATRAITRFPAITRFNAGKLSKLVSARIDQAIRPYYEAGAQILTNWFPMVEGPMIKRSGAKFVKAVDPAVVSSLLVPFHIANESDIMIEFGASTTQPDYIRFMKDAAGIVEPTQAIVGSPTAAIPVSITVTGHGFATAEEVFITGSGMDELNGRYFKISVVDPNTFTLDNEDGSAPRATGTGGTVARTYQIGGIGDDLNKLDYVQNQNSMYFTYQNGGFPRELIRTDNTSWTFAALDADWPPFEYDDTSGVSIQASAATGTGITLTASSGLFTNSHVSRLVRLTDTTSGIGPYEPGPPAVGGEGYAVITFVGSSTPITTATADVVKEFDPQVVSSPTTRWAWDAWNSTNRGPTAVAFFDDRLWFAGSAAGPDQVWASRIGSYRDFSRDPTDAGGLHFDLKSGLDDAIVWLSAIDETLVAGTNRNEWTIESIDRDSAIAAGNVRARVRSGHGSEANVIPVLIDKRIVFAQRVGRKLRDFRYEIETNNLDSADLTRLSREITVGKIEELAYQQEPNRIVWTRLGDGSLAALTHEYGELVTAWSDVELGGDGAVANVAVLPTETETSDEAWLVIDRTIDGSPARYIEQIQPFWDEGGDIEDAFFLDGAILYDGAPATEFVGANHLEGETVSVFADGFLIGDVTIVDGSFTLETAASKVVVGYEYVCQYLSMPIEGGSADGTSQGKPESIARLTLRLDQAGEGLHYGTTLGDLVPIDFRETGDPMDEPVPLFDGDKANLTMPMNQTTRRTVALEHRGALPCTIVGAFPRLEAR